MHHAVMDGLGGGGLGGGGARRPFRIVRLGRLGGGGQRRRRQALAQRHGGERAGEQAGDDPSAHSGEARPPRRRARLQLGEAQRLLLGPEAMVVIRPLAPDP